MGSHKKKHFVLKSAPLRVYIISFIFLGGGGGSGGGRQAGRHAPAT